MEEGEDVGETGGEQLAAFKAWRPRVWARPACDRSWDRAACGQTEGGRQVRDPWRQEGWRLPASSREITEEDGDDREKAGGVKLWELPRAVQKHTQRRWGGRLTLLSESWKEKRVLEKQRNVETHIPTRQIESQQEFAVWSRTLKQGLCVNLEEWDGEEMGGRFRREGDMCIYMADSCWGLPESSKIL